MSTINSSNLRPFFSFYGSKWRVAARYGAPQYATIIEPFAGSAGYSTRFPSTKHVRLYDIDPVICGVWDYLIHAPSEEIARLPIGRGAIDRKGLPEEARNLIGFWYDKGMPKPAKAPGTWMRSGKFNTQFWGPKIRARLADQVKYIRHWTIEQKPWTQSLRGEVATYFIDPPYVSKPGRAYTFDQIDYAALGRRCKALKGQVIVCEQMGAKWLPFVPFLKMKANAKSKVSFEAVWLEGAN